MQQKKPIRIHRDRVPNLPPPVPAGTGYWLRRLRRRSYPLRHPFPSPNAKHWGVYAVKAAVALARHRYPISLSRGTK